jgi:hypothetical protein
MRTLPRALTGLLPGCTLLFSTPVWHQVQVFAVGVLWAPSQRQVTAARRVLGLGQARCCHHDHRELHRAVWTRLEGSRVQRWWLGPSLAPSGPLLLGVDHPLERRRGVTIQAQGVYRDAGRSAHRHLVKATGRRVWA